MKSGKQQAAVEEGIDPVADYTAKVKEVMQEQKCDRVTACTRVSKAHPQLHAAYLLATNTSSKAQRLIREKLE